MRAGSNPALTISLMSLLYGHIQCIRKRPRVRYEGNAERRATASSASLDSVRGDRSPFSY